MPREKPHINLVFIGHVNHGKSTLLGRLYYDLGLIDERTLERLKKEAEEKGKKTWEFAYFVDRLKQERETGMTIDVYYEKLETPKYFVTVIDAPGHASFVKNMITGTSQADAAVLVVSAKEGVMPQTKEHAFLAKVLGINQLIVAINFMDAVNYDQKKYEEVKEQVLQLLKGIGYKEENLIFVPTSGLMGDNVVKKSDKMPWWKGPTLYEALDQLKEPPRMIDKPLRIPIQDVYSITGVGTVPVGRVETGVLKVGDKVIFNPPGIVGEVKSIETHHTPIQEAVPGDNIGFNVRGVSAKDIKRGHVAGHPDNPPTVAKEFTAQIVVLEHPTAIAAGYTPVFHVHTAQVSCRFAELQKKIDPRTGAVIEENPSYIKRGDSAIVKIVPTQPLCIEKYQEFPPLGRFAVRDMGKTIAAGIVLDVVPK